MAVLQKIRNRAGLMVAVIGVGLVGFLLMDALNSNSSLLFGGSANNMVGKVAGEEISIQEFEKKVSETIDAYQSNYPNNPIDDATRNALREQTWNQYIKDILLSREFEELGINVTSDELFDLVQGNTPHPAIQNAFKNPETGIFDPAQVLVFLKNMNNDQTGESKKRWLGFEKYIKEDRLNKKFTNLIKKSIYIPTWFADDAYQKNNKRSSISYVHIPYTEISDEEIEFSESEFVAYLEKHKEQYKQEAMRDIEYVTFAIQPSAEDTSDAKQFIEQEIENFKTTESDSVYIKLYSDEPFASTYYTKDQLSSIVADTLFKADTNTLIGPYYENGAYKVAKVLDKKLIPDSVNVRHILFKINQQQDPTALLAKIDSVKQRILNGEDFNALAVQYSDDPGSGSKGGELGWVKPNQMVKPFNDAIFFKAEVDSVLQVISQFGVHLVQVTESNPTKEGIKVAFLSKNIYPSSETESLIYNKANEFAIQNRTAETFQEAASKEGLMVNKAPQLKQTDYTINGLGYARDVTSWAYQSETGTISDVISLPNQFVVAHVANASEEGTAKLDDVRTEIKMELAKQKKFEKLKEQVGSISSLEAMNKEVKSAPNLTFSSFFVPGVGREEAVVGYALSMEKGATSGPIKGESGLFVLRVDEIIEPGETENLVAFKKQIETPITSRVDFSVFEALKNGADIEDNRYKFY